MQKHPLFTAILVFKELSLTKLSGLEMNVFMLLLWVTLQSVAELSGRSRILVRGRSGVLTPEGGL